MYGSADRSWKLSKIIFFEEGASSKQKKAPIVKKFPSPLQEPKHMSVINRESPTKRYCEDLQPLLSLLPSVKDCHYNVTANTRATTQFLWRHRRFSVSYWQQRPLATGFIITIYPPYFCHVLLYRLLQKQFHNGNSNVTVWRVLR
jgi:hypothetical protein